MHIFAYDGESHLSFNLHIVTSIFKLQQSSRVSSTLSKQEIPADLHCQSLTSFQVRQSSGPAMSQPSPRSSTLVITDLKPLTTYNQKLLPIFRRISIVRLTLRECLCLFELLFYSLKEGSMPTPITGILPVTCCHRPW